MILNRNWIKVILFLFILNLASIYAEDKKDSAPKSKKQAVVLTILNPHNISIPCSECHKKEAIEGIDTPETVVLTEENVIDLCNRCHKGENLHPVGKNPSLAKVGVKLPAIFPLGIKGSQKDKIVCTTCHLIHSEDARDKMLRGFPRTAKKGEQPKGMMFRDRREMCMSCHEKEFVERSPHNKENGSCVYCHTSDPSKADDVTATFAKDIVRLCNFCHERVSDKHYEKVNPFNDVELKQEINKAALFMVDNKPVCSTCHEPHGESQYPSFLRENFVKLAEKSRYINPHWKGVFCLSCHETIPQEGQKAAIRFNDNYNKLCMWCHVVNPTSVADVHPVNVKPVINEYMKIPPNFILKDSTITCITCHDPRIQEKIDKEEKRDNRQFLRGIKYTLGEKRSEVCFQCHIQQQFSMLNAHDQIDDQGELVEDSCKYCHTSRPDRDTEGLEKIDPSVTDLSALCFRCHSDGPHPGKIRHLVKIIGDKLERKLEYEKKNDVSYPLDKNGNIFCATCHNPHEAGIVNSLRAAKGADTNRRARLSIAGGQICFNCHDKDKEANILSVK